MNRITLTLNLTILTLTATAFASAASAANQPNAYRGHFIGTATSPSASTPAGARWKVAPNAYRRIIGPHGFRWKAYRRCTPCGVNANTAKALKGKRITPLRRHFGG